MVFSLLSCFFCILPISVSLVLMVPMILDGGIQLLTPYESKNGRRFVTGLLFGYGLGELFLSTTIMAFEFGRSLVV